MTPAGDQSQNQNAKGIVGRLRGRLFGYSYTMRVTVTFALIAIMTVIVAMGVLSFVWEQHFQAYTRENVQTLAESTASSIAHRYEKNHEAVLNGETDPAKEYPMLGIEDVAPAEAAHSLQPGMGIQVVGPKGMTVVYDSSRSEYTGEVPQVLGGDMSFAPEAKEEMAAASIVLSDGRTVGTVRMWMYGSDLLLSKADQAFRQQSLSGYGVCSGAFHCAGIVYRLLIRPRAGEPDQSYHAHGSGGEGRRSFCPREP